MPRIPMTCGFVLAVALSATAQADVSQQTIDALGTPESIETSIGILDFKDGAPSAATAQQVFDAFRRAER